MQETTCSWSCSQRCSSYPKAIKGPYESLRVHSGEFTNTEGNVGVVMRLVNVNGFTNIEQCETKPTNVWQSCLSGSSWRAAGHHGGLAQDGYSRTRS